MQNIDYDHHDWLVHAWMSGTTSLPYNDYFTYNKSCNLISKDGVAYTYTARGVSSVRPYAVSCVGSTATPCPSALSYIYDAESEPTRSRATK